MSRKVVYFVLCRGIISRCGVFIWLRFSEVGVIEFLSIFGNENYKNGNYGNRGNY